VINSPLSKGTYLFLNFIILASDGSTVVEHLPHYPKVEGSSPSTSVGTIWEKIAKYIFVKNILLKLIKYYRCMFPHLKGSYFQKILCKVILRVGCSTIYNQVKFYNIGTVVIMSV